MDLVLGIALSLLGLLLVTNIVLNVITLRRIRTLDKQERYWAKCLDERCNGLDARLRALEPEEIEPEPVTPRSKPPPAEDEAPTVHSMPLSDLLKPTK